MLKQLPSTTGEVLHQVFGGMPHCCSTLQTCMHSPWLERQFQRQLNNSRTGVKAQTATKVARIDHPTVVVECACDGDVTDWVTPARVIQSVKEISAHLDAEPLIITSR